MDGNSDTLSVTVTSESSDEERGDSGGNRELDSKTISRTSRLIKKEHKEDRRRHYKRTVGLCTKCHQHASSRVNGVCKTCIAIRSKGKRGRKRMYEVGAPCSRCNMHVYGSG